MQIRSLSSRAADDDDEEDEGLSEMSLTSCHHHLCKQLMLFHKLARLLRAAHALQTGMRRAMKPIELIEAFVVCCQLSRPRLWNAENRRIRTSSEAAARKSAYLLFRSAAAASYEAIGAHSITQR